MKIQLEWQRISSVAPPMSQLEAAVEIFQCQQHQTMSTACHCLREHASFRWRFHSVHFEELE